MAPGRHPAPARSAHRSQPARRAVTDARRAALFASGLQRSDAPSIAMAAEAIKTIVRRIGIGGCLSRMPVRRRGARQIAAGTCGPGEQRTQK